jgi:hypothetical protein
MLMLLGLFVDFSQFFWGSGASHPVRKITSQKCWEWDINGYIRIYTDICGYTRIYSDRKFIGRRLQSQDCFVHTNHRKPGLAICLIAILNWLKIQGKMFRIIHIKQCLDIKAMGAYFLTILRSDYEKNALQMLKFRPNNCKKQNYF